jgi:hypothetical protein
MRSILITVAILFALAVGPAIAADKEDNFKRVPIPTIDGVELEGTFYPAPGKKDACVLLLHNFDRTKGGNSHQDGWDHLAEALQKKGYPVLEFDFRGFGNSKKVNPMKFWSPMFRHNLNIKPADKNKETIDQKYFPPNYYPNLVNDIAAAKAYLDRRNDAREVNTSNLIVIGAGEGAALGALWMATQCHLQKDRSPPGVVGVPVGPPALDDPESRDLACAVFLSISPTVAGNKVPVKSALTDIVRLGKVRTALIQGKNDSSAQNIAKDYIDHILGIKSDYKSLVARKDVAGTNLSGSKLLNESLDTETWIIDTCLDSALEKRAGVEWKRREIDKFRFFWALGKPGMAGPLLPAKLNTDELYYPIPLDRLLGMNGP